MTIDQAKRKIAEYGTPLSAVYEALAESDRDVLKEWFVGAKGVPNLAARKGTGGPGQNLCRCGGVLVRTGTCETCSACGESSGGCG